MEETEPRATDVPTSSNVRPTSHPWELGLAMATFAFLAFLGWQLPTSTVGHVLSLVFAAMGAWGVFRLLTRKAHRRAQLRQQPFPPAWEEILRRHVIFFQTLDPVEQVRFRQELQVFIGEKHITGIGTTLDDTVRVLAAASAIIPIFGFPDWEWNEISEILIYPNRFSEDFAFDGAPGQHDRRILGMVGTGAMDRIMILTKPDLLQGFYNADDKRNVGLHEFAHLVDKTDGAVDGVPEMGLDRHLIGPWIELVRRKMLEMEAGKSDLNPYGLTNEAEFFAVASEYFFEKPGTMKRRHPELYDMLARIFRQDLATRAKAMAKAILDGNKRFGRNSPCPCGSGIKYKKCCLLRSRT